MPDRRARPVVLRGGTVIDSTGERRADVVIEGSDIVCVDAEVETPKNAKVLDASSCFVVPGLVDLHTHARQPGAEESETIESAARSASLGGFTAFVAMPNTDPPIDCAPVAREVLALGSNVTCRVCVSGAITVGRRGELLAPMGELAALGVRIFTDDGSGVQDAGVMRRAMDYAKGLGVTLAQHCEDSALAAHGHMHEGAWSSRLGLPGAPGEAEEVMAIRDIALCRLTAARLHLLHISSAATLRAVEFAKAEGLPVTAEVTPHHLSLTDASLQGYDAVFKVNPPLRTSDDVHALRAGCATGAIDAIATDHAPHPPEAKDQPVAEAPPGMLGLETALAVAMGALVRNEPTFDQLDLSEPERFVSGDDGGGFRPLRLNEMLALMSWKPAHIAGIAVDQGGDQGGPIAAGLPANICVIDPTHTWVVDARRLASRSRNTPFEGRKLEGKVRHTIYRGEPV
ncbi:MAG: dihydroorotase, partial [Acidimicrobiales bacterium]